MRNPLDPPPRFSWSRPQVYDHPKPKPWASLLKPPKYDYPRRPVGRLPVRDWTEKRLNAALRKVDKAAREEARLSGQERYTASRSCRKGHTGLRLVSSDKCVPCSVIYQSSWATANQEKKKAVTHRRRARLEGISEQGNFTAADIVDIVKMQKGKCAICGKKLGQRFVADHIVPISRGGSNHRRNIQVAHRKCNAAKGAQDPVAFQQKRGRLL